MKKLKEDAASSKSAQETKLAEETEALRAKIELLETENSELKESVASKEGDLSIQAQQLQDAKSKIQKAVAEKVEASGTARIQLDDRDGKYRRLEIEGTKKAKVEKELRDEISRTRKGVACYTSNQAKENSRLLAQNRMLELQLAEAADRI